MSTNKLASLPTIKRLPSYLHIVEAAKRDGKEFISGTIIADELGLEPIQVRKDLAVTGIVGKPRIGFPVDELIRAINSFLQWDTDTPAIIVGAGHLGTALMGYVEFPKHGLNIRAAFDVDERKIGTTVNQTPVYSIDRMPTIIRELGVKLAILTVPNAYAQDVADDLIDAGITAIWNFTNMKLKVPDHIIVQKEDLSSGYAVLSVRARTLSSNEPDSASGASENRSPNARQVRA